MRTRLTKRAGVPGTKRLCEVWGEKLLYVRYRYDAARQRRVKTVEIIVEERPWQPGRRKVRVGAGAGRALVEGQLDYVHIRFDHKDDAATRTAVKRLGGFWDERAAAWRITAAAVTLLDLTRYIVK